MDVKQRGDIISHINHSQDLQASRLCEPLGAILNNIVNPHCTISDSTKEYSDAESNLSVSNSDESKSFWRKTCAKILAELGGLN